MAAQKEEKIVVFTFVLLLLLLNTTKLTSFSSQGVFVKSIYNNCKRALHWCVCSFTKNLPPAKKWPNFLHISYIASMYKSGSYKQKVVRIYTHNEKTCIYSLYHHSFPYIFVYVFEIWSRIILWQIMNEENIIFRSTNYNCIQIKM